MKPRGFTLIELMMALALFAVLISFAGPIYGDFMGNSQIRNAGENILTGIRLAQADAIRNNRATKFVLDITPAGGWAVFRYDDELVDYLPLAINNYKWVDGASKTSVTTTPGGATTLTFDGLGRVVANGYPQVADSTLSLVRIDVTNPSLATPRNMAVLITSAGTGTKLCDVLVAAGDPRSCL